MFECLLLTWQQIYHLTFLLNLWKFLANFTLLKYVKFQRIYGFLITKELIFGFQILDLKDHFSASLNTKEIGEKSIIKERDLQNLRKEGGKRK